MSQAKNESSQSNTQFQQQAQPRTLLTLTNILIAGALAYFALQYADLQTKHEKLQEVNQAQLQMIDKLRNFNGSSK